MAENSSISWCDDTFNPWLGCAKVSPACDGCYAEALVGVGGRYGRAEWGGPGKGEGTRVRTVASTWAKPRRWEREAAAAVAAWRTNPFARPETPQPTRFVFCASLADVFDNAVPSEWRRDLFDLIRETPHLTWLLLTKRPGMILKLWRAVMEEADDFRDWPKNAAIGCTIIDQTEADRDVPKLLAAKAALKPAFAFVSMEPLLGLVDFGRLPWRFNAFDVHPGAPVKSVDALTGAVMSWDRGFPVAPGESAPALDWVITGGETDQGGHKARPADPAWFRSLRDQCAAAGVPFHFKQWGEWQPGAGLVGSDIETFGERVVTRAGSRADPGTLDGDLHHARPLGR